MWQALHPSETWDNPFTRSTESNEKCVAWGTDWVSSGEEALLCGLAHCGDKQRNTGQDPRALSLSFQTAESIPVWV